MFKLKNDRIDPKEYVDTITEICQQPEVWKEAFQNYQDKKSEIEAFLEGIASKNERKVRVVFTGAGSSEYVGNIVVEYLKKNSKFDFESIATTDIVSCPKLFLKKDQPTLLVSFARSGNSPESIAAVDLVNQLVDEKYHMAITCAESGKLAVKLGEQDDSFVLIMPDGTNDKGFAMTSSLTSMMLSALLIFDTHNDKEKEKRVNFIIEQANQILTEEEKINELANFDFTRIVYLGSGPLYALTNEARLKILELTAGQVASLFESSMGFRHGPKSFVDDGTYVIGLISNDEYTRKYDLDILNEVAANKVATKVLAIAPTEVEGDFEKFLLTQTEDIKEIEDVFLAFPYLIIAQLFAVITSVHVGNTPDSPSKTGTVNRVVKGVQIHQL